MNSTDESTVPPSSRRRRRRRAGATAALVVAGLAAVAGCQSTAAGSSASSSPTPSQAAATSPAAATSTPVQATQAPAVAPTLGQLAGVFANGIGFGQIRPPEVYNGGDPTGLVNKITWQSWGGATATGTGTSTYVAANQPVAAGTQQSVTVVAFRLGTCGGKLMYQAVEWFFPQHGQAFSSTHYENVCTGTYVPAP